MTNQQKMNIWLTSLGLIFFLFLCLYSFQILHHCDEVITAMNKNGQQAMLQVSSHFEKRIDDFYFLLIADKNQLLNLTKNNIFTIYQELRQLIQDKLNQFLKETDKEELLALIKEKIINFGSFSLANWFKK
ncbi:MAG: hypothetical protein Q8888_02035 [Vigna little leaf phytoplasma]|nr:hypothetical protein [Vigna little leaf phytoplasma]